MSVKQEGLVVKFGSSSVADREKGIIHQSRIDGYAEQLAALKEKYNVVVVTSGAAAVGNRRYQEIYQTENTPDARILASLGSAAINEAWYRAFRKQGMAAGQALVTHREIKDTRERESLLDAVGYGFRYDVTPVFNENDLLGQEELSKLVYGGDNDGLASHLGTRIGNYFNMKQKLLLLTDVDGFLKDGEVQPQISAEDVGSEVQYLESQLHFDSPWPQRKSSNSIVSKLIAAQEAVLNSNGRDSAFIGYAGAYYEQIMAGEIGTQVVQ